MFIKNLFLAAVVLAAQPAQNPQKASTKTIRIAALPSEDAPTQQSIFSLLTKELGQELRMDVVFVRPKDYAAMLEGLNAGHFDVALVGAVVYSQIQKTGKYKAELRAVREGFSDNRAAIIVRANSPFKELEDLRGKTIAFVDAHSTTGYVMPVRLLEKHKMVAPRDFTVSFLGSHLAVAEQVSQGKVVAGAVYADIINKLVNPESVTSLAFTDPAPDDPLILRSTLDAPVREKIRKAFVNLKNLPGGSDFLLFAGIESFAPASDADYAKFLVNSK